MNKSQYKNVRVLIVEDETALNEAYAAILESKGITVESSFNGEEALETVREFRPQIILLDLRMPKMDGLAFLEKFSSLKGSKDTQIIIFSNYDEQEEIDTAFALGANRYMLKSWTSPDELIRLIDDTMAAKAGK